MKRLLPRSLFHQMVASSFVILLTFMVLGLSLTSRLLNNTADEFISARLRQVAIELSTNLSPFGQGLKQTSSPRLNPRFSQYGGDEAYAIFDNRGALVAQGPRPVHRPPILSAAKSDLFLRRGQYDVLVHPISILGRRGLIVVQQDRNSPEVIVDDIVEEFTRRLFWFALSAGILFFLSAVMINASAIRKIRRIAGTADRIDMDRLEVRLDERSAPTELAPLIHAANRALDRLEAGFRAQNEFVANVAHELRTPLAVVALRAEAIDNAEVRASIHDGISRTSRVVGQLLELACMENAAPQFAELNLSEVAHEVIVQQAPLVYRSGKTIELRGASASGPTIHGNAELITIVLSNLIDNAVRHTPAGTAITVAIGPGQCISVIDDGPGVSEAHRMFVWHRYWRADRKHSDGAGLGLNICQRVMNLHNGTLELVETGGAGAHFRLNFTEPPNPMEAAALREVAPSTDQQPHAAHSASS